MSAKRIAKKKSSGRKKSRNSRSPLENILLALSLVPFVAGVLLIAAWALDWDLLGSLDDQIVVGTLFILLSFAASNLIQRRWLLGTGWFLLMVADALLLTAHIISIQIAAGVLGVAGSMFLGFEFFKRVATQNELHTGSKS